LLAGSFGDGSGEVFCGFGIGLGHRLYLRKKCNFVSPIRLALEAHNIAALPSLQQGDLVRVLGEVWGKDILEPLGKAIQKARLNVDLPPELENLILPRPTTYVLTQRVDRIDSKADAYAKAARRAGRPYRIETKKSIEEITSNQSDLDLKQVT